MVFCLVDNAAVAKALCLGDLTREPVVINVCAGGENQTEQTSTTHKASIQQLLAVCHLNFTRHQHFFSVLSVTS